MFIFSVALWHPGLCPESCLGRSQVPFSNREKSQDVWPTPASLRDEKKKKGKAGAMQRKGAFHHCRPRLLTILICRSSKPPGIALLGDHSELNVENHNLEAQVPQVSVLSKVKCAYSYYLGDLVAANDLACCYVVREEMIRVLHGESGEKSLLKGHSRQVFDVRFSPVDPRLLASAGRGGRILVWDLQGQTESPVLSLRTEDSAMPDSFPSKLAWHPTKKVLAMAFSNNVVRVVNVGELIKDGSTPVDALVSSLEGESRKIECSAPITDLMFSKANPDVLAVSQQNGNFILSNWNTGASLWEATGHDGNPMHAVRFTPA